MTRGSSNSGARRQAAHRWPAFTAACTVATLACALAAADEPTAEQLKFFESKVRPLLAQRCYECHGEKEQNSGLRLDTAEGLFNGGDSGLAITPGKPEESLLLTAVSYQQDDLQMPPDRKLDEREIADLTRWVEMGAPHPGRAGRPRPAVRAGGIDLEQARQFWAFQPPLDPPPPGVNNAGWPHAAMDRFVLASLNGAGLAPVAAAGKRVLLRRVTFDLTGLPPTADEIADFLADDTPTAFVRVVDRLLASPSYGERWGRHWLDVARYADSNGLDENIAHGHAWKYRDYVVAAFNADKPFDRLVLEQLAGDRLAAEELPGAEPTDPRRHELLVATGFLSLGPKVLAEVDETKMEMDIVDEQIDTVGRAFLGLTLGCARCHDHKFDPIAQADYYALAGVFKSTRTMEHFTKIARWWENPIPRPADLARQQEHESKLADARAAVTSLIERANAELKATLETGAELPKDAEAQYPEATRTELKRLRGEVSALEKAAPEVPAAMGVSDRDIADVAVHVRGSHLTLGEMVPRRFPTVLAGAGQDPFPPEHSGRLRLARWLVAEDHPLTARVIVNRVWRWHFGRGLVGSTDNFGELGERPTNQPLLDWLTRRFVDDRWSIKRLHRRMLLSATYALGSGYDAPAAAVDPENRLWWRMDVRRLEAEELRDALLAVSGRLERGMGGSLLNVKNREFIFDHTSIDKTDYSSPRRSLYLPVIRNNLYDVFQLFDYTDASGPVGNRATTTVAPQALFLMNGDLVAGAADALAARLLARADLDDVGRVRMLYESCYGRPPIDEEFARAAAFVGQPVSVKAGANTNDEPATGARQRKAWSLLCQAVLASNEFVYVR
ncbi:MAG TPA: PSD1 and planctomycete cytochrome C domain-containing protein [Planctomycetaceae bacterium]|nr:PSD1 and planctomycete cytochrome C domain-containing protein [Planctomycetaceae bacterium]